MKKISVKEKQRDTSLDAVAGLFILHMIMLHCIQNTIGKLGLYETIANVLMFFMPWFFFKNGIFINNKNSFDWHKEISRLLKPFVIYSAIGFLVGAFYYCIEQDEKLWKYILKSAYGLIKYGSIQGNLPLWFLLSLFLARMTFVKLNPFVGKLQLSLAGAIIGLGLSFFEVHFISWLVNLPICVSFLTMGAVLREFQYDKRLFAVALIVFPAIELYYLSLVDIHGNALKQGNYILWWIASLCGIIVVNNISRFIKPYFLIIIGCYSMQYYVCHWIVMLILLFVCYLIDIEHPIRQLIVVCSGEFVFVLCLYFKHSYKYIQHTK